ncbi:MAG TPA: PQQ-binding-like beta-propeller repeat protein [Gemmatimonadaceae bacterium]|nr:PQQ-binding-like beta-propeller repeat protein [Gemmatimonadaceae bacterium]
MARRTESLVYIGIKSHVIAFHRKTGAEVWRTQLPAKYKSSASFVNVVRDAEGLFATCAGEVFALDPRNGNVLWSDPLKGLGTGLVTLVTDLGGASQAPVLAESVHQQQAAATAATTAAV